MSFHYFIYFNLTWITYDSTMSLCSSFMYYLFSALWLQLRGLPTVPLTCHLIWDFVPLLPLQSGEIPFIDHYFYEAFPDSPGWHSYASTIFSLYLAHTSVVAFPIRIWHILPWRHFLHFYLLVAVKTSKFIYLGLRFIF